MQAKNLEAKEMIVVEKRTDELFLLSTDIKIVSQKEAESAAELLGKIKQGQKFLKDKKEEVVKPLNDALKKLRGWFAPLEDKLDTAEATLKAKLIAYKKKEEEKAEKQKQAIAAKVEKGEMKFSQASQKIGKLESRTEMVSTRKIKTVRVIEQHLIPLEYWIVDMVALRRDALAGKNIPGVKVIEEETVVNTR